MLLWGKSEHGVMYCKIQKEMKMFRERGHSGFFLVRDIQPGQDSSLSPQIGDVASVKVDENKIEIRVKLESEDNGTWKGKIISYRTEIKGRTPSERLDEIKRDEQFIDGNNLTNGTEIFLEQNKIFGVSRG
jgi:hypothetical protein